MSRKHRSSFEHLSHLERASIIATVLFAIFALISDSRPMARPVPEVIVPTVQFTGKISAKEIVFGDQTKKQVMFTFDGGEGAQSGYAILAALQKHDVKGTFFLTGKFIEQNPDLVRLMVAEGDEIFSHTYDHPHLTELSDPEIANEFHDTEQALIAVANVSPRPFFRPPYGDRDERVLNDARAAGYESVYWSADGHDWEEQDGESEADVRDSILSNIRPGAIFLMHVGDTITGKILDSLLTEVEKRGYTAVSLTQGL